MNETTRRQLALDFASADPLWRELEEIEAAHRATGDERSDPYFGTCPHCDKGGVVLNVGPNHWLVCRDHGVKWCAGFNIFSFWEHEDAATWASNARELEAYRDIG